MTAYTEVNIKLDKYEYSIKAEKIKKLAERRDYETAAKIADGIDWDRIRNVKMLTVVSQVYEKVGRYGDAKDILLLAYERAPVGRRFLYKLTELAVKQGEFAEAEEYLKEFAVTSPQDPSRLLLRYEISKAKGASVEQLITILEAYQKREFEEKWSYELASLYYQAGKNEACIKLCDELILWFGVGPYVDKALELKQKIAPLTPEQIEKKENKEKYLRRLENLQKEAEEKEERELQMQPEPEPEPRAQSRMQPEPQARPSRLSRQAEEGRRQAEFERSLAQQVEVAVAKKPEEKPEEQPEEQTESRPKTKTFVFEARAIREALQKAQDQPVDVRMVEKRAEELERETAGAAATTEEPTEEPKEETETEAEAAEEAEAELEAETAGEAQAELEPKTVGETEPEAEPESELGVAGEAEAEAETEMQAAGETQAEPAWQPVKETEPEPAVEWGQPELENDHYLLVACDNEESGLHECVAYIRRMREQLGRPATQMAKIHGEKLVSKDLAKTFRKLGGRDLIITGIAAVPSAVLREVIERAQEEQGESFVALLDTKEEIDALREREAFFGGCPMLDCTQKAEEAKKEQSQSHKTLAELVEEALRAGGLDGMNAGQEAAAVPAAQPDPERKSEPKPEPEPEFKPEPKLAPEPESKLKPELKPEPEPREPEPAPGAPASKEMTAKEFFEFADNYARMLDAMIDDLGGLALFAAAEQYQQDRIPLTEELAQELVEKAILRAEKRSLKNLLSNRYNKEGYLILKEEHFKE